MAQEPTASAPQNEPRKHSLFSRLLVATAFSTIGAKVGTIGTVMDANAVFNGEKLTLGEKLKSPFNGKFKEGLGKRIKELMTKEGKSLSNALLKLSKWTLITTAIGTVAGGIIGWIRGGRVESWKDIFKHPWQSTKLILGFENAPEYKQPIVATPELQSEIPANSSKWTDTIKPKQKAADIQPSSSHIESVAAKKSTESPVLGA